MPIDPSIYSQVRQPEPVNQLAQLAQVYQLQGGMQANALNKMKMDEAQRGITESNALNGLYRDAVGPDGTIDRTKLYSGAAAGGLGSKIPGLQKGFADSDEAVTKADAAKFKLAKDRYDTFQNHIGALAYDPALTKDKVLAAGQSLVAQGLLPANMYQQTISTLPDDPEAIRARLKQGLSAQLPPEKIIEMFSPKATAYDNGQQMGFRDTNPNSPTYGQTTGGAPIQKQQTPDAILQASTAQRGQDLVNARSQEQFNAPQYMETDNGLVALPKKLKAGQLPVGTPVTTADGTPLSKPLKQIPPTVNSAIIQNSQSIKGLDRALALLDGKNIGDPTKGGMTGDAAATGVKGYLPNGLLNRIDPQGIDARAEISDIGSLKIHDRSGAAVTISESPRLMPFIPLATDDAATVKKKLSRLRVALVDESTALQQTYSKDQGYRPSPVNSGGATGDFSAPDASDPLGLRR